MELRPSARPALVVLVLGVLAAGLLVIVSVGVALFVDRVEMLSGLFLVLPLGGSVALAAFVMAFDAWITVYQVDEEGIRVRRSFLQTREERVQWDKVTHAVYRQGPIQRPLGLASLHVVAYGAAGTTLRLGPMQGADKLRRHVNRRMLESATLESWLGSD